MAGQSLAYFCNSEEKDEYWKGGFNTKIGQQNNGKCVIQYGQKIRLDNIDNVVHLLVLFSDSLRKLFLHLRTLLLLLDR